MKLAIGSKDVPIGAYTRKVLDKLPPRQSKAILANVRSEEPDVKGITGKLTQGAVDAGFLYVTDVRATRGQAEGDRAAGRAPAVGRPTASPWSRARSTRSRRRRSSPAWWTATAQQALQRGRLRAAAHAVSGSTLVPRRVLVVALCATLLFLVLPVVAIFADTSPVDLLSTASATEAALRRAVAEPAYAPCSRSR